MPDICAGAARASPALGLWPPEYIFLGEKSGMTRHWKSLSDCALLPTIMQ